MSVPKSILIVGGGFGGVNAAKTLAAMHLPETQIRVIDPKDVNFFVSLTGITLFLNVVALER